jgi:hypothetical protein
MARTRTLPTHLGTEDKLIDCYFFSLTVAQALNLLGGGAIGTELLNEPGLGVMPLVLRQALAGAAVLLGLVAAFWRIDGASLWTWLLVAVRFTRLPRWAVTRPPLVAVDSGPDDRWYEVRPPLAWKERRP